MNEVIYRRMPPQCKSSPVTPDIIMFSPHNWKPLRTTSTQQPITFWFGKTMINTVRQHINVSRLNTAARYHLRLKEIFIKMKWMRRGEKNAREMYGLCQETHWDWIDLDDMNNLADTKGGNINAHIYSNLSRAGGAWMLCFWPPLSLSCGKAADAPGAELIQKCIFASELFTYRCMIMIPRLIRDKSRCCRLSSGALEVTCFFPADL